jgi:hypothetical protein
MISSQMDRCGVLEDVAVEAPMGPPPRGQNGPPPPFGGPVGSGGTESLSGRPRLSNDDGFGGSLYYISFFGAASCLQVERQNHPSTRKGERQGAGHCSSPRATNRGADRRIYSCFGCACFSPDLSWQRGVDRCFLRSHPRFGFRCYIGPVGLGALGAPGFQSGD